MLIVVRPSRSASRSGSTSFKPEFRGDGHLAEPGFSAELSRVIAVTQELTLPIDRLGSAPEEPRGSLIAPAGYRPSSIAFEKRNCMSTVY
jgi:hypothetical protein